MSSSRTEQQDIIRDTIDRLFQSSRGRSIRFPRDGGRVPRKWSRRTLISKRPPPKKNCLIRTFVHMILWYSILPSPTVPGNLKWGPYYQTGSDQMSDTKEFFGTCARTPKLCDCSTLLITNTLWAGGRHAMPPPQGRQATARSGGRRICCRRYKLCSDLSSQPKRPGDLNIHLHLHLFRSKIQ